MADNMTAGKKLIDPMPIICKLADRTLYAKDPECSLLREVIDLLMAAEDVADIYVANNWVPVTERLPELGGYYLVSHKSGFISERLYYEGAGELFKNFKRDPVTHWMPLPERPKGDDHEST